MTAVARYALITLIALLGLVIESWAFMILIGVVHSEWLPMMPTISYWSALRVGAAMSLLSITVAFAYGASKEAIEG